MRRLSIVVVLLAVFAAVLPVRPTSAVTPSGEGTSPHATIAAQVRPVLRRGSSGPAVVELQRRLNVWIGTSRSSLRLLPANGVFGPQTEVAVRAFQRARGLPVTGVVGASTWARLPAVPPVAVTPPPARIAATIRNFAFTPNPLRIRAGTTIVWTNADVAPHTVAHGNTPNRGGVFDSGTLMRGQSFALTLRRAGTYPYFCLIHPDMTGVVVVTAQ